MRVSSARLAKQKALDAKPILPGIGDERCQGCPYCPSACLSVTYCCAVLRDKQPARR
jgi:hypothetical protein